MCINALPKIQSFIDPIGSKIRSKVHAKVDGFRDRLYEKAGMQGMQLRDPWAEKGGASKYIAEPKPKGEKGGIAGQGLTINTDKQVPESNLTIGKTY